MTRESKTSNGRRGQKPPRCWQIYYHPKVEESQALAHDIARHLSDKGVTAEAAAIDDEAARARLPEQDIVAVIGGDGSMLRGGNMVAPHGVPLLGINLGRLGFLAEVQPEEWEAVIDRVLAGDYWIEERMMLRAELHRGDENLGSFDVLNEVVVSRGALARPIRLRAEIDGDELTTYVADGLIVSTATGSTAYALAVGGPILPPELKNILIVPIAPHLSIERGIVLSDGVTLEILVRTEHQAILSADGRVEVPLLDGDRVVVRAGPFNARFARVQDPVYFYRNLTSRMTQNPSANKAK